MRIAGVVFMALMGVHVASSLVHNHRTEQGASARSGWRHVVIPAFPFIALVSRLVRERTGWGRLAAGMQTLLFLGACWFGYGQGIFSRQLASPLAIGSGLLAGHVIFGLSLLATHRSARDVAGHFLDLSALWDFVVENPRTLTQFINVSIAEEVMYRVGAQSLLIQWTGNPLAGIVIVAAGFSMVHEHFFRNSAAQSAEFVAFALLLSVLYFWTGSLILVIAIHAVRNIEIAFIEHLIRKEADANGEVTTASEEEYLNGEHLLVAVVMAGTNETMFIEYSDDGVSRGGAQVPIVAYADSHPFSLALALNLNRNLNLNLIRSGARMLGERLRFLDYDYDYEQEHEQEQEHECFYPVNGHAYSNGGQP